MTEERKTFNTSPEIVCPWCGHKSFQEELFLEDDQTTDVECSSCEKEFEIRAHVSIDYTATRVDEEMVRLREGEKARRKKALEDAVRIIEEHRASAPAPRTFESGREGREP